MNDGRILYNRWEYVDKGRARCSRSGPCVPTAAARRKSTATTSPRPPVFNQARHVPGRNNLVVCLGAGHCPGNMGAILLVDLHKNKRTAGGDDRPHARLRSQGQLGPAPVPQRPLDRSTSTGRGTAIRIPLADAGAGPVAGKFFLVSCNPDGMWNDPAGYGIYLLDVFGNRVPIYRDPEISCWQARPLEPRRRAAGAGRLAASRPSTPTPSEATRGRDRRVPGARRRAAAAR